MRSDMLAAALSWQQRAEQNADFQNPAKAFLPVFLQWLRMSTLKMKQHPVCHRKGI